MSVYMKTYIDYLSQNICNNNLHEFSVPSSDLMLFFFFLPLGIKESILPENWSASKEKPLLRQNITRERTSGAKTSDRNSIEEEREEERERERERDASRDEHEEDAFLSSLHFV